MQLSLSHGRLYVNSLSGEVNADRPSALFIHGVLCDHSVWQAQMQAAADQGWNALALDLPGHGLSSGQPPTTVEQAAACVAELADALQLQRLALVGHSWGSLIALQAAADLGERVSHLALLATASPMKVAPALLQMCLDQPTKAIETINLYSHGDAAGDTELRQAWLAEGTALNQRIQASQAGANPAHAGLSACDTYRAGPEAMARLRCPVLVLSGTQDRMTPAAAALPLLTAAEVSGVPLQQVQLATGHSLMREAPGATAQAIAAFLQTA